MFRGWSRTAGAWMALVLLVDARMARADTPALDLTWNAPAGCPDRAWMESAIVHLVTTQPSQPLQVTGAVREAEGRWRVDLEFHGAATGKRSLSAASCASVSRGAALIVALALDPQAAFGAESPEPTPPPPPPAPEPTPSAPPESPPPPAEHPPSTVHPIAFAGVSASRALVPGLAPGAVVGGGVVWRKLRIDLSAELAMSTSESLAARPSVGADFALGSVALRTCLGQELGWISVDGCTALRGARISGEGTGLAESYRQTAHLLAVEPGVIARFPNRSHIGVELDAAAVVPLARPEFVILTSGPSEPLFRVSPIGVRVGLGASVRF